MQQTLPTLTLLKTKEILCFNIPNIRTEFSASMTQYELNVINGAPVYSELEKLIKNTKAKEVPYALIVDYSILHKSNFNLVKALRSNPLNANLPIIAIANSDVRSIEVLKSGIDDVYVQPVDYRDIYDRIEFLKSFKSQLVEVNQEIEEDVLHVSISPFKRVVDIILAGIFVILLSPILLITALLIRFESKGPIIYRSKRSGTGYQVFDFLKFRSMYADADQRLEEMQHLNQYSESDAAFVKFKNDPRITRIGKFIRKTSIDELPQLFNVLKGDMSIVGNRPLPLYEAERLTKEDMAYRFIAPAGITGLWQITKRGGNDMSAEERIGLDVTYAKENSFWYDILILLKTPFAVIQKENV
jgi:lipopolysaccharide/colanic/teichoic acid biosynthesis glycosyltransferase